MFTDGPDLESDLDLLALDDYAPAAPSRLDQVIGSADMKTVHAAEQLMHIDAMRVEDLGHAGRYGAGLPDVALRSLRLELAAALRITEYAAGHLLDLSEALVHRYPAALRSMLRARMTQQHAEILVASLDELEPELRDGLLSPALALAEAEPVGTFRRALRRLVDAARAQTLVERHKEALTERRTAVEPVGDGMAWLHALLPAVEAYAIHGRLTRQGKAIQAQEAADPAVEHPRTLDQARADILCDLLIDGESPTHPEAARGIRATVVVTVPALALLGHEKGCEPATVEGVGPIPIDRARALCGAADGWMRVLTHPETGAVLSVGRDQYRPPASLRRLVRWRADRCNGPGCGMPASRCELDHSVAWEHGGETSVTNLAPLCKNHHIVKHHGGWSVRQLEGGALEWVSPAGRRYVVEPERKLPVFRVAAASAGGDPPF